MVKYLPVFLLNALLCVPSFAAGEPFQAVKSSSTTKNQEFATELLSQARQLLLDQNYGRIITLGEKIIEIGSVQQKQQAMELMGIARERQQKFAQAQAIYSEFLSLYPDSELAPRIENRLNGLQTMQLEPRERMKMPQARPVESLWDFSGSLSQYYRDDRISTKEDGNEEVNQALVSDISLFARRKTDDQAIVIRFDGGLVNDFLDNEDDTRLSRAQVRFTDEASNYQWIVGRQNRTARGVLGRFDGLVFDTINHSVDYSLFLGYPVASSNDGLDTDAQFFGTSVNFSPGDRVDVDIYLLQQDRLGLTDRQAIGSEVQYRNDQGFFYGMLDYDTFYSDLNYITAIFNYRVSDQWALNTTYDYRNSPLLTTRNALQGQAVKDLDALGDLFTEDEIYQLAEDRTSKNQNLVVGSNYQLDDMRQLYLSLSLSSTEATETSGGITASPAYDSMNLSVEYSERNFFVDGDFSSFGSRLSESDTSSIISLRGRTRIPGSGSLRYDPRLQLDYRHSKDSDVNQWILKPSFKLSYKPRRHFSMDASLGIEYSEYDLPELNDHVAYNLFIGYVYQF
jgi:hypothetical protein